MFGRLRPTVGAMSLDELRCPWCAEDLHRSSDETIFVDSRLAFAEHDSPNEMRTLYHPWCWREYQSTLATGH